MVHTFLIMAEEACLMITGKYSDSMIYRRHSIRKYTSDPVSQEDLEHILHSAMAGPSANNYQPWSFIVIDDRALLDGINQIHPYAGMMKSAPLAIVACVLKNIAKNDIFYQQDLGAAIENMLLAAVECGLGSCWCAIHPNAQLEEKFVGLLKIPDTIFPLSVVAFGHPADARPASDRFDPARIQRNSW
jgi:nitroreductase